MGRYFTHQLPEDLRKDIGGQAGDMIGSWWNGIPTAQSELPAGQRYWPFNVLWR
jgi:hypothetical protein